MVSPSSLVTQKLLFLLLSTALIFHNPMNTALVDAQEMVTTLQPQEFYEMAYSNSFAAIIDVRRGEEWEGGHIPNATLMENLQMDEGTADFVATIDDIIGCKSCPLVVYCRTGARAGAALEKLVAAGFEGPLYNGLGVNDWTDAGYLLVQTESANPPCKKTPPAPGKCLEQQEEETLTIADDTNNTATPSTTTSDSSGSIGIRSIDNFMAFYLSVGVPTLIFLFHV